MVTENPNGTVVAVGEARDALPAPELAGLRAPDTHTKVVGVIYPPPDIRAIVDKTAGFVARNGTEFEKRILSNEKQNQKFSFLLPTDPYHAYYQLKIKEVKEADSKHPGTTDQAAANQATAQPVPVVKELEKPAIAPTKPLEPPPPELYSVHLPQGLTLLDLDIIKLTAQFVARNGKAFLTGLASREHANPNFNFLKPTHSMFTFFTALADAYSKVLMPPKGTLDKLEKDFTNRDAILERALKRLEWDRHKEAEAQAIADEQEAERVAMASIDWHDFVVVETIGFDPAEDEELPLPMTVKDVIQMSKSSALEAADEDEENEDEMEMEMDEEEKEMVAAGAAGEAAAAEGLPENIKVVKNYKRTEQQNQEFNPNKLLVSPITGELVPVDQMAEHLRISLIDPRWKEQKEAMLSKIKTTTKANDDEISRNIIYLAGARPDIFGSTEEEMSAMVQENIVKEKKAAEQRTEGAPVSSAPVTSLPPPPSGISDAAKAAVAAAAATAASLSSSTGTLGSPPPRSNMPPPPPVPWRPPPMGMPPGMPWIPPGMPPPGMPPFPMRPPMQTPTPSSSSSVPPPSSSAAPSSAPSASVPPPASEAPPLPTSAPTPPMPSVPAPTPSLPEKRPRQDFVLRPESDILVEYPGARKVRIAVPDVEGNDKLNGQVLEVEVGSLSDNISELKARLAEVIGLGANKQKLIRDDVGVMRDNLSLAHYNVLEDVQLTLGIKERGRGKK